MKIFSWSKNSVNHEKNRITFKKIVNHISLIYEIEFNLILIIFKLQIITNSEKDTITSQLTETVDHLYFFLTVL